MHCWVIHAGCSNTIIFTSTLIDVKRKYLFLLSQSKDYLKSTNNITYLPGNFANNMLGRGYDGPWKKDTPITMEQLNQFLETQDVTIKCIRDTTNAVIVTDYLDG